jgi:DNA-binding MarR family transcriptional regulator
MALDGTTGLQHLICFELYAASRAMTARYRTTLDAAGLTYPQYLTLCVLAHRGPTTVRDLGEALRLDSGTLSPLLKRLETQGHVTRERGDADERTVWITLTDSGHHLHHRLTDLPRQIAVDAGLTPEEFRQLHHLLNRIRLTRPTEGTT